MSSNHDPRPIIWFDIDNCLYSKDAGVDELMKEKIEKYFEKIGIPSDESRMLRHRYYTEYGLAIRGLVRHHKVDPLDYDAQCDAALPLENVLKPDPERQQLLRDIDRSKFRVWALTNAYVNHATRVLRLLGLADYFEAVVSCDYTATAGSFSCKPEPAYYNEALAAANATPAQCYFVDDSALNIKGAHVLGWAKCVLFDEHGDQRPKLGVIDGQGTPTTSTSIWSDLRSGVEVKVVSRFTDLREVWKEVFVQDSK
ncbi:BQ2448_6178 [Microbotryum intermedium]|uniref:BQ2448_6178 protein n=1 Tax=Microbotryum intermedium TaxID=269621 RepID=A0A238FRA8_9BASI|nr:BQ2448_6178 [Microbotryum intermedium]